MHKLSSIIRLRRAVGVGELQVHWHHFGPTGFTPNGVDLSSPSGLVPVEARLISYNVKFVVYA